MAVHRRLVRRPVLLLSSFCLRDREAVRATCSDGAHTQLRQSEESLGRQKASLLVARPLTVLVDGGLVSEVAGGSLHGLVDGDRCRDRVRGAVRREQRR